MVTKSLGGGEEITIKRVPLQYFGNRYRASYLAIRLRWFYKDSRLKVHVISSATMPDTGLCFDFINDNM